MTKAESLVPADYAQWLTEIKARVQAAQTRAAFAVNAELVRLYWEIGKSIAEKVKAEGWGARVVERLSEDLMREFPDIKGFSPSNLKYMRRFAEAYPDGAIGQQPVDQLPWTHHLVLLTQLKNIEQRESYARAAIVHGWSRNVLAMQIETRLIERQGQAITNFPDRLPAPQSDMAQQALKDPYLFDFLSIHREAQEREIETGLVGHIVRFLVEMGAGFAFAGRQVRLEVGGDEFFIDLLFYHLKLRCYVVVELKATAFKPEHAGKLNFYLTAVDAQLKHPTDNPTIGLLLCKDRNRVVAEYALRNVSSPIGVAEYQLVESLPENLEGALPSIDEIEAELAGKDESAQ